MKAIRSLVTALGLAFVLPVAADAAATDPEVLLYRFPSVVDNGGTDDTGVATAFHCTNFSGVPENVRFVTRGPTGNLTSNQAVNIQHLQSSTAATHHTVAYQELGLTTGVVNQGTTAIAATSINVICTAMTIDASTTVPIGVALRGIRFNPVPGSQE